MNILTLNAGSSSIKYKIYAHQDNTNTPLLSGLIEGIGESGGFWSHQFKTQKKQNHQFTTHQNAFDALGLQLRQDLVNCPVHAVGHRVVHGGKKYFKPTIITPAVLNDIQELARLAPLHNPINAQGIVFAKQYFKDACQVAVFDTGFHHSMPLHVSQYAIDRDTTRKFQIQRYGFHGINHEYVAIQASIFLNKPLKQCNFITLHLGNGASACLIKNGKSFDTSMGMTPLAGLIMGTRCGDVDPAIPLYLMEQGMTAREIDNLLNKQSGLKGISNDNDMRKILARIDKQDAQAKLAIEMYVYAIQKTIGAYLSQISSLDALIFTGGVGENAAVIRANIITPLKHMGFQLNDALNKQHSGNTCNIISDTGNSVLVIRGDEESLIVQKIIEVM